MNSPDDHAVLAWSKTIEGVRFRSFAFSEGCGRPDCEVCSSKENGPIWATFMRPLALEDQEQLDEWCLCLIGWGPDDDVMDAFEQTIEDLAMADEDQQLFWRKVAALIGVRWSVVAERPYEYAVRHKKALDECVGDGLVGRLVKLADPDQLRKVRDARRDAESYSFGEAFGQLFWELIGKYHDERHRGS